MKQLLRVVVVGAVSLVGVLAAVGLSSAEPVSAQPAPPPAFADDLFCGFVDVPFQSFFTEASCYLKEEGITTGTSASRYSPVNQVNRAQMAAFLWRAAGSPAAPSSCGFTDSASIPVFARQAACWMKAQGITTNNPYKPTDPVNRSQMAAFLWRAEGFPAVPSSCGFNDAASIPVFARQGACWMKAQEITTNNPYKPTDPVTRAQMAAFLWRTDDKPQVTRDNPAAFVAWFDTTRETDRTVTLPLRGNVNVTINWGDGNTEQRTASGDVTHTYSADGYYKVTITGTLERYGVRCGVAPNVAKLIAVPSFGQVDLTSLQWAFAKARNLGKVARLLPAGVVTIEGAFGDPSRLDSGQRAACSESGLTASATTVDQTVTPASTFGDNPDWSTLDITQWDTSTMTDMSYLFTGQTDFNQDISGWDVSNVTDMFGMFAGAAAFNQPLGNWNVSNVTDMGYMFAGAAAFNQDIDNWNVSNVTWLSGMFRSAFTFNQPLGNWNVSNVRGMGDMFANASEFNQPIGNWNVRNVTDMRYMFYEAAAFNQPIGDWNVRNVTEMQSMFENASAFNQPLDKWNVFVVSEWPGACVDFSSGATSWTELQPKFDDPSSHDIHPEDVPLEPQATAPTEVLTPAVCRFPL